MLSKLKEGFVAGIISVIAKAPISIGILWLLNHVGTFTDFDLPKFTLKQLVGL